MLPFTQILAPVTIVYCILDYTEAGGTERTLSVQANHFAARGDDVHIVTTETLANATSIYHFSDKIHFHNLGINYREVDNSISPLKAVRRIIKGRLHRRRLTGLLLALNADITVTMFGHEQTFLHKIKDGSRKVTEFHFSHDYRRIECRSMHTPLIKRQFTLLKEWRKRLSIRHYDAFVVLTHIDAAKWRGLDNIHVIPNAIPFIPSTKSDCSNHRIIAVGRLTAIKGFDLLIEAWRRLGTSTGDWTLEIYGTGEDYPKLMQQISHGRLSSSVKIHPPVKDIASRYAESSIYAMASRYEGFGLVLIEAMACGVPCVSFACECGPAEIISDGEDGCLVPTGDIDALAAKILMLMQDDRLRKSMGQKARDNVARFMPDKVMKQWEDLFASLTGKDSHGNA